MYNALPGALRVQCVCTMLFQECVQCVCTMLFQMCVYNALSGADVMGGCVLMLADGQVGGIFIRC